VVLEIVKLHSGIDRQTFNCGQDALNQFFHHHAGRNQKLGFSVTYVGVDEAGAIAAFMTLCGSAEVPGNLPFQSKRWPAYLAPTLLIARLGVDQRFQGKGAGAVMLRHAMRLAKHQFDTVGCIALVTDAKPEAIPFYQRFGFQYRDTQPEPPVAPVRMVLAVSTFFALID